MSDLALDPDKKGNNHARVLNKALDYKKIDKQLYMVPTKLWSDKAGKCVDGDLPMWLPHEMMDDLWQSDAKSMQPRYVDPSCWDMPAFKQHAVTKANGVDTTCPLTLYADATPFRARDADSFYAVYVQIAIIEIKVVHIWLSESHNVDCMMLLASVMHVSHGCSRSVCTCCILCTQCKLYICRDRPQLRVAFR